MIRKLELADVDDCAQIMYDEYRGLYNEFLTGLYPKEALDADLAHCSPQMLTRYKREGIIGYVAEVNNQVAGLVLGEVFGRSGVARIDFLGVRKENRGQKLGDQLLDAIEDKFRKCECHKSTVSTFGQLPNVSFYKAHGYFEETVMPRHYWKMAILVLSKFLDGFTLEVPKPAPQPIKAESKPSWARQAEAEASQPMQSAPLAGPQPPAKEAPSPTKVGSVLAAGLTEEFRPVKGQAVELKAALKRSPEELAELEREAAQAREPLEPEQIEVLGDLEEAPAEDAELPAEEAEAEAVENAEVVEAPEAPKDELEDWSIQPAEKKDEKKRESEF